MGSMVSNSVAQPVAGGSTSGSGGFFGRLIEQALNSGILQQVNEQPTQPTGITSIPVTNQNPTVNMTGGRFNQVRDPRLNRVASRPMFRTSRYDSQISNLLGKLLPDSAPSTPQMRPTTDPMGRSYSDPRYYKTGGRVGYANGTPMNGVMANALKKINLMRDPRIARLLQQRQARAMGGIMNLKMGGVPSEMDLRARGGFVPIGKKERADDVPARLSKNEFVFTANAVRNAGNGDIRKGAKRMYNLMHQLEAKK